MGAAYPFQGGAVQGPSNSTPQELPEHVQQLLTSVLNLIQDHLNNQGQSHGSTDDASSDGSDSGQQQLMPYSPPASGGTSGTAPASSITGEPQQLPESVQMLVAAILEAAQEQANNQNQAVDSTDDGSDSTALPTPVSLPASPDGSASTDSSTSSGSSTASGSTTSSDSSSSSASQPSTQTVLNGDATTLADPNAKCPPGVTMQQMMDADGGLLKNLGNQTLTGAGAAGITGGIKDNLAKKSGGTSANDIGTNMDVTWRALQNLQAFKNTPGSNGQPIPDSIRHNGNVSGLQPSGEAARGSTVGELQDWFKGAISGPQSQLPVGDKVDQNGVETTGLQQVGAKIAGFFSKVFDGIKKVFDDTIGKIPLIGKILTAPVDLIAGSAGDGLQAASDAISGHTTDAKQEAKQIGVNALTTIGGAAKQGLDLVGDVAKFVVPEGGQLISIGAKVLGGAIDGATHIGAAAINGENVGQAVKQMGEDVGGSAISSITGI